MTKFLVLLFVFILSISTTGCENAPESGLESAEYTRITPEEAYQMMQDENIVILDVRTQAEFDEGHIKNAVLLPVSELASRGASLLPNYDQTILIYCRSGRRSEDAARTLIAMGYKNVYDFGGIVDWPFEIQR